MTIRRRDFQKASALIHEFLLKLNEDVECAELRDALNLALLHMQRHYRTLRTRMQQQSQERRPQSNGNLSQSLRGLSPMTPFRDAPDKFQWKWVNLESGKITGTLPADYHKGASSLPMILQAARDGNNNMLLQLIERDADCVFEVDATGRTALMYAVQYSHLDTVQFLLESGNEVNAIAHDGSTAVHRAAHDGNHEALRILIEYQADLQIHDNQGRAPIHWACACANRECLQSVVSGTSVHEAAMEMISNKLLLEQGVEAARDREGMTPSMWACRLDHIEHLELLGAGEEEEDGYERDLSGRTWMHWAVRRTEPLECLKTLLTQDSASLADHDGKTVAHTAAELGSLPSMKVIIEIAGVGVMEQRDASNRTPLILATIGGHGELVNYLLAEGAVLAAVDNHGATAWDYARVRQLHYCMLIIASYLRHKGRQEAGDGEPHQGPHQHLLLEGAANDGIVVNGVIENGINSLQINGGDSPTLYYGSEPVPAPHPPMEPQTPRTPRTPRPKTPATPRAAPRTPRRGGQQGATPRVSSTPRAPADGRTAAPPVTPRGFGVKRSPSYPDGDAVFDRPPREPSSAGSSKRLKSDDSPDRDMQVTSVMSVTSADGSRQNSAQGQRQGHDQQAANQRAALQGGHDPTLNGGHPAGYHDDQEFEEDARSVSIDDMDVSDFASASEGEEGGAEEGGEYDGRNAEDEEEEGDDDEEEEREVFHHNQQQQQPPPPGGRPHPGRRQGPQGTVPYHPPSSSSGRPAPHVTRRASPSRPGQQNPHQRYQDGEPPPPAHLPPPAHAPPPPHAAPNLNRRHPPSQAPSPYPSHPGTNTHHAAASPSPAPHVTPRHASGGGQVAASQRHHHHHQPRPPPRHSPPYHSQDSQETHIESYSMEDVEPGTPEGDLQDEVDEDPAPAARDSGRSTQPRHSAESNMDDLSKVKHLPALSLPKHIPVQAFPPSPVGHKEESNDVTNVTKMNQSDRRYVNVDDESENKVVSDETGLAFAQGQCSVGAGREVETNLLQINGSRDSENKVKGSETWKEQACAPRGRPKSAPLKGSHDLRGGKRDLGLSPGGLSPGGPSPGGLSPGGPSLGGLSPGGLSPGGRSPGGLSPGGPSPGGLSPGGLSPTGVLGAPLGIKSPDSGRTHSMEKLRANVLPLLPARGLPPLNPVGSKDGPKSRLNGENSGAEGDTWVDATDGQSDVSMSRSAEVGGLEASSPTAGIELNGTGDQGRTRGQGRVGGQGRVMDPQGRVTGQSTSSPSPMRLPAGSETQTPARRPHKLLKQFYIEDVNMDRDDSDRPDGDTASLKHGDPACDPGPAGQMAPLSERAIIGVTASPKYGPGGVAPDSRMAPPAILAPLPEPSQGVKKKKKKKKRERQAAMGQGLTQPASPPRGYVAPIPPPLAPHHPPPAPQHAARPAKGVSPGFEGPPMGGGAANHPGRSSSGRPSSRAAVPHNDDDGDEDYDGQDYVEHQPRSRVPPSPARGRSPGPGPRPVTRKGPLQASHAPLPGPPGPPGPPGGVRGEADPRTQRGPIRQNEQRPPTGSNQPRGRSPTTAQGQHPPSPRSRRGQSPALGKGTSSPPWSSQQVPNGRLPTW